MNSAAPCGALTPSAARRGRFRPPALQRYRAAADSREDGIPGDQRLACASRCMDAERGMTRALPFASPVAMSSSALSKSACWIHSVSVTRRRTAAARQLSTASSMGGPRSADSTWGSQRCSCKQRSTRLIPSQRVCDAAPHRRRKEASFTTSSMRGPGSAGSKTTDLDLIQVTQVTAWSAGQCDTNTMLARLHPSDASTKHTVACSGTRKRSVQHASDAGWAMTRNRPSCAAASSPRVLCSCMLMDECHACSIKQKKLDAVVAKRACLSPCRCQVR